MISRVVGQVRPTVIYTHSLHDVHQDHRNRTGPPWSRSAEIGRVYCFQSPSATVDFRPTRFVTIDDQLASASWPRSTRSRSQVEVRGYLDPDLIESTARYWSRYGDGRYAEAFEVIRETAALPTGAGGQGHSAQAAVGGDSQERAGAGS